MGQLHRLLARRDRCCQELYLHIENDGLPLQCLCDYVLGHLDRPLTPVLVDAIINSYNSWLNGMTSDGQLYGGEIQFNEDNNPTTALISGKFRLDTKIASPVPAQEIDMYVEYDVDLLTAAFAE